MRLLDQRSGSPPPSLSRQDLNRGGVPWAASSIPRRSTGGSAGIDGILSHAFRAGARTALASVLPAYELVVSSQAAFSRADGGQLIHSAAATGGQPAVAMLRLSL
jgi:hypothetical protein